MIIKMANYPGNLLNTISDYAKRVIFASNPRDPDSLKVVRLKSARAIIGIRNLLAKKDGRTDIFYQCTSVSELARSEFRRRD